MSVAPTTDASVTRLPWAAVVASLIAFGTLFISEGGSLVLPILAVALICTYFFSFRLETKSGLNWIIRIALWSLIILIALVRPANELSNGLYDARTVGWIGEMFAAELTLQAWRRRPEGGHRGVVTILLSGVVFGAGSNVYQDRFIPYITPVFALFLALSLRQFRPVTARPPAAPLVPLLLLLLALSLGMGNYLLFHTFRAELTNLGMQFLHEHPVTETSGVDWNPRLNPTFGLQGSDERALRIVGAGDLSHLRGMAFDTYNAGAWEPRRQFRPMDLVSVRDIPPTTTPDAIRVTRLTTNGGMLFAPLNVTGLDTLDGGDMKWAKEYDSPVVTDAPAPNDYAFAVGGEDFQGPFCAPPTPQQRQRLLNVPATIDPKVKELALQIAAGRTDPRERIEAIQAYLLTHHAYSLTINPGPGDPISNFLLKKMSAHCQFFGSAVVILARCLGIPARYVEGYYAHESDGQGATIVRNRDAHAWAECWIEGKGWVTVDATPGGGRPDQNHRPIRSWTRFMEWTQDFGSRLRSAFSGPKALRLTLVILGLALIVLLWQWRRQIRPTVKPKLTLLSYSAAQEELASLFVRFEAQCRKQGLLCPPGQPWREYLERLTPEELPPGFDREAALAFLQAYNAARFGSASAESIVQVRSLLPQPSH